jgi:general secretion pathway protein J
MKRKAKSGRKAAAVTVANRLQGFSAGFTLLEVTVTLTILGFILLIIFGAFRLGLSAWERGESSREEVQTVRTVTELISRQIKSVVPYKFRTKKAEGDYLAFEGKARSLKLVSALPVKTKRPEGFVYASYEFKEGGPGKGSLILYEERALNKNFFEEPLKEDSGIPLLEGISGIRFEYLKEEDPDKNQQEEWVEEFSAKEEKNLPKSVRMTITLTGKNGKGNESTLNLVASIPANRFEDIGLAARRAAARNRLFPGRGATN